MGIKTNELQQLEAILGTDSLLADTAAAGTGRVALSKLAEILVSGNNAVRTALDNKAPAGFGLGTPTTPHIEDLDTAPIASGWYQTYENTINIPDEPWSNYASVIVAGRGGNPTQILIGGTNANNIYVTFRKKVSTGWSNWQRLATATPPTWYDLPITSDKIVSYGNNRYTKDQFGLVTVQLTLKQSGDTGVETPIDIATLPSGFRPQNAYGNVFYSGSYGTAAAVHVSNGGLIKIAPLLMGEGHTSILFRNLSCQFSFYSV